MTLYLVRHGEALSETEDPERPLNQQGREEVTAAARVVGALGVDVARIVHSGRLRARQTAEILAAALQPRPAVEVSADLAPMADPRHAAVYVHAARESLMLVGHLPHLGRLISALVIGNATRELIACPTGAVVALDEAGAGGWRIKWMLTPRLARVIG